IVPMAARWPLMYYLHAKQLGHAPTLPVPTRRLDLVTSTARVTPPKGYSRLDVRRVLGDLRLWSYSFSRPQPIAPDLAQNDNSIHQPAAGLLTGSFKAGHRGRSIVGSRGT